MLQTGSLDAWECREGSIGYAVEDSINDAAGDGLHAHVDDGFAIVALSADEGSFVVVSEDSDVPRPGDLAGRDDPSVELGAVEDIL